MAIIDVPEYTKNNKSYNQCWDGQGDNAGSLPRCEGGGAGGSSNAAGFPNNVSSIAVSDAKKLQGRQEWTTESTFSGPGDGNPVKKIDPAIIKEIYINEDVYSPFLQGYMVIDTWAENLERKTKKKVVEYLNFRNDARDEFVFELKPNETPENIQPGLNFPAEYWSFKNKYVIYDKEDLGETKEYKIKKFYFWDKNYQLMRERKIQWSTGIGTRFVSDPPQEPIAHQPDSVRSMLTGEAMASLLWDAGLGEYIDFDNWDWGSTSINYSIKAQETVWEALNYIYANHVSKDYYDQCLWLRDRYTRKYQLVPFWKIFKEAGKSPSSPGPFQREHLFAEADNDDGEVTGGAGGMIYTDRSVISPWKAPLLNANSNTIDVKVNQWGFITNYSFTDMAGIDNSMAMVSKPVHTHWNKKKQFIMNFANNEIETVRESFIKPYRVDYVLGNYPLYTLNKTKTDQVAIHHKFSLESTLEKESDAIMRLNKGKNEIAFANLFLNETMGLTMYGSTHRQSGMFIGVDRLGWSDNDFDYKFCGQWYVTTVVHQMLHNKYVNHITMVKLHAYKKFEQPPDESIT